MDNLIAALFGALGASARYTLDRSVMSRLGTQFPAGTMVVNFTGAFLLGILFGLTSTHQITHATLLIAGTGAIGAFTTFSTLSFETISLLRLQRRSAAIFNIVGSFTVGVGLVGLGYLIGSRG